MPIRDVLELSVFLCVSIIEFTIIILTVENVKKAAKGVNKQFCLSTKIASMDKRTRVKKNKIHRKYDAPARHNGKTNRTHY